MRLKLLSIIALTLFATNGIGQNATQIDANDGIHYITTVIDLPLTGTYYFQGAEPIVEISAGGNGYYQLHEQAKRPMTWGIECDQSGLPIKKKGFDNAAYTLWYQYTDKAAEDDAAMAWKPVSFTVHFNTQKMFIQGERCKTYSGELEK